MNSRGRVRDDQPEQGSRKRGLSAVTEQDEQDQDCDPTAAGSNQGGAFEGQGNAILQQLENMLQRKARFDDRSFRSQLRRNLRRLCEREGIPVPTWLEDTGLKVDEMKRRWRRMTKSIIQQQLSREDDGPANGQPGQGSAAATPGSSPLVSPRGESTPTETVSAARMVGHILDNVLSDLRTLYPDAFPSQPAVPAQVLEAEHEPVPDQNHQTPPSSPTEGSDLSDVEDPRMTRSEPALTPRAQEYPKQNVAENALPEQGSIMRIGSGGEVPVPQIPLPQVPVAETALPEGPVAETALPGVSVAETALPEEGSTTAPPGPASEIPAEGSLGSWQAVEAEPDTASEFGGSTVASYTVINEHEL